jgi:hypothetical protein
MAIGLEDDLIDIKGRVVYSIDGENERFEAGIEFIERDDAAFEALKKYIKAFREKS